MLVESIGSILYEKEHIIFTDAEGGFPEEVIDRVLDYYKMESKRHKEFRAGKVLRRPATRVFGGYLQENDVPLSKTSTFMNPESRPVIYVPNPSSHEADISGHNEEAPEPDYSKEEVAKAVEHENAYKEFIVEIKKLIRDSFDEMSQESRSIVFNDARHQFDKLFEEQKRLAVYDEFYLIQRLYGDIDEDFDTQTALEVGVDALMHDCNKAFESMRKIHEFDINGHQERPALEAFVHGSALVQSVLGNSTISKFMLKFEKTPEPVADQDLSDEDKAWFHTNI